MFTASIQTQFGDRPFSAVLGGTANGNNYELFYPRSFAGTETGSGDFWTAAQPLTRDYADPNTTPFCFVAVSLGQGNSFDCQISGYLVNLS